MRYTHDWVVFDEENSRIVFSARTQMSDPGNGESYTATSWTMLNYAGNGLFSREEDVYNGANFGKFLEDWMSAKIRARS